MAIALVDTSASPKQVWANAKPKYGPAGNPKATPLHQSNDYFRRAKAPDYWALAGYYVPQFNGHSCSVASMTMVLNAARAPLPKTSDDKLLTQEALLDQANTEHWKDRVSKDGHNGNYGTSLDVLGKIALNAFKSLGFPRATVEVIHIDGVNKQTIAKVRRHLVENEKSTKDFILANFNQASYTDDADVGHIAPVAAFDAKKDRILVMDPDREWYEPYWVSLETFVAGLATRDPGAKMNRGLVVIRLH
jgi:hypothetical protein